MTHEQAVKEKIARQQIGMTHSAVNSEPVFIDNIMEVKDTHPFQQSYITQNNFEIRKFLFISYKKLTKQVVIPTGLCAICEKLQIEHI